MRLMDYFSQLCFITAWKLRLVNKKLSEAVTKFAHMIIEVTAVQFIRGRFCLSRGGRTALWQAAEHAKAGDMLLLKSELKS